MDFIKLKPELQGKLSKEDIKDYLTLKYPDLEVGFYGWATVITKSYGTRIQLLIKKDKINVVADVSQQAKAIGVLTIFILLIIVFVKYNKERNAFAKEIQQVLTEKYS